MKIRKINILLVYLYKTLNGHEINNNPSFIDNYIYIIPLVSLRSHKSRHIHYLHFDIKYSFIITLMTLNFTKFTENRP